MFDSNLLLEEVITLKRSKVPIWEKITITVDEASEYSNIGINKIYEMMNLPHCDFILYVGERKRLIKRKQFEQYIDNHMQL